MPRWPLLFALVSLGACGGGEGSVDSSTTPVDHAVALADHETAELAARLTALPGYSYVDPPAGEVAASLALLHEVEAANGGEELFSGVSYHSVVADDASQNKAHTASGRAEVGYLGMMTFAVAPPASAEDDPRMLEGLFAGDGIAFSTLAIGDVTMLVADDAGSDDSRFTYAWLDDGVLHLFDGATRPTMERWLEHYVAESSSR